MSCKSENRSNHKPQSTAVQMRNKRIKAERHARRMAAQNSRDPFHEDNQPKVARGTARMLRRKPLQDAYAKRMVNAAA